MKKILIVIAVFSIISCGNNKSKEENDTSINKDEAIENSTGSTSKDKKYNTFIPKNSTKIGEDSPLFTDYKNYEGGTTSLSDLKGKLVYIDVWATWCGPCIQEIPSLKKLEEEFRDQDIAFVSISVDALEDEQEWKDMVEEYDMEGVQLFANGDAKFMNAYGIQSIPRFILIDDEGKIMDYDTYRPSNPELKNYLTAMFN